MAPTKSKEENSVERPATSSDSASAKSKGPRDDSMAEAWAGQEMVGKKKKPKKTARAPGRWWGPPRAGKKEDPFFGAGPPLRRRRRRRRRARGRNFINTFFLALPCSAGWPAAGPPGAGLQAIWWGPFTILMRKIFIFRENKIPF